ncbi:MAG: flagellar motor protein MotB [Legionellales bacterium]|nr:flagellar motor protein MotB [Legionellales bacterium]
MAQDKESKTEEEKAPIIVKKIKAGGHGHHGGAWKIAYADFVTAMMAFFLLMWLLASLNKYQKEGIAEYFKDPLSPNLAKYRTITEKEMPLPEGAKAEEKKEKAEEKTIPPAKPDPKQLADQKAKEEEKKRLEELKKQLLNNIKNDPQLSQFKDQIYVDVLQNGLRIRLNDIEGKPMFESGSSELNEQTKQVMEWLGKELNNMPNKVVIVGHTDAKPFAGRGLGSYSNWELSVDRANATRRALVGGGLEKEKIMRISGVGSSDPLDKANPENPINRRINVYLLTKDAEKQEISLDK